MEQRTHESIAPGLCGRPVELGAGRARVVFETTREMAADQPGLVHGGFTFGLAHYAATLAVNGPTVVPASAQTKFLGPVVAGGRVEAEAAVERSEGKKRWIEVVVRRGGTPVFEAELFAVAPGTHILDATARRQARP